MRPDRGPGEGREAGGVSGTDWAAAGRHLRRLLDGRWTHHSREEIIIDLLARATPADQSTPGQSAPDDTPRRRTSDDSFVADGASADGQPGTGDVGCAADAATESDLAAADFSVGGEAGEGARSGAPGTRVGVELRVGLSTLLGLDRHPGEIPGWGAVTAETARALSAAQHRAEWRYAITDPDGGLILGGITRRRPSAPEGNGPDSGPGVGLPVTDHERAPVRGGIVELHIPATLLADLAAHPGTCGPWAAVISDLAAQYRAFVIDTPQGCDEGWAAGPVRPVRRCGVAPPHPDPRPVLCLHGVPLLCQAG